MKGLTPPECLAWARERGLLLNESGSGFSRGPALGVFQFPIPSEARKQIALSQALMEGMTDHSGALLWITDWPLYKAHEMALVTSIRAGFGETRPLIDAPGHLGEAADRDLLAGMLALVMAFGCDAYLATPEGTSIVFASHHDLLDVFTLDGDYSTTVRDVTRRFGLEAT